MDDLSQNSAAAKRERAPSLHNPRGIAMKKILLVLSSPRGTQSHSHQIAYRIVEDLRARHAGTEIVIRDVAKEPLPYVGEAFVGALFTSPTNASPTYGSG